MAARTERAAPGRGNGGQVMISAEQAVMMAIVLCVSGALLTLALAKRRTQAGWAAFLITTASAALVSSAALKALLGGPSPAPVVYLRAPVIRFSLLLHVDGLSAVFLLLAAVVAVPSALYAITYLRHYPQYGVARYYPHCLLFLAAIYGLLSTADMMWFFFIFWQLMTLPGFALIRFEHERAENRRAAIKFLLLMEVACAATMAGAAMLAVGGASLSGSSLKYDFDSVSATLPLLLSAHPRFCLVAFALFLVGFGIKMGMWPFGQFWLPDAHPAAPSPVSAMLSGVMIKTGVYGLMRYFLWLVPAGALQDYPLAGWGCAVAVLGTITLFTGTMQALKQEHSKRLLAFHSIGQVGYILLGAGACMALLPLGSPSSAALAAMALTGALFHTVNHGLFKGLLFLNAGSMLYATGTQDLNRLGGLMRFMPLTGITALIASFSISGVPLFNGFASKWTLYVAAVQGGMYAKYLPVCAALAILTSALTLASFIKFFGVSFLSRSSALVKQRATQSGWLDVGWMMLLPQWALAAGCLLLGVAPGIAFHLLRRALAASPREMAAALAEAAPAVGIPFTVPGEMSASAVFVPMALLAVLAVMWLAAYLFSRLGGAPRRAAEPWLCGYVREADCHRYAAHNFYGEIKRYFGWLGGAAHPGKTPAKGS